MEQKNLFDFEIAPAFLSKKDITGTEKIRLQEIHIETKNGKQEIIAKVWSNKQGDRIVGLRIGQAQYIKKYAAIISQNNYELFCRAEKTDNGMSLYISVDNKTFI